MEEAACIGVAQPDIFFPEQNIHVVDQRHAYRTAKRICDGCEVKLNCLAWALKNEEDWGMWGGATPPERRQIREKIRRRTELSKRQQREQVR